MGMLVLILAIIPLPFLKPGSAEFVVDLLAIIVAIAFLGFVAWDVRREARTVKRRDQGDDGDGGAGKEASDES